MSGKNDRNALERSDDLSIAFQTAYLKNDVEAWRQVYEMASQLKDVAERKNDAEAVEDFSWIAQMAASEMSERIGEEQESGGRQSWDLDQTSDEEMPTLREALPQALEEAQVLVGMARDLVIDVAKVVRSSLRRRLGL